MERGETIGCMTSVYEMKAELITDPETRENSPPCVLKDGLGRASKCEVPHEARDPAPSSGQ